MDESKELITQESLGPRTQEIVNWVRQHEALFLSRLADLSLQKLGGLGWQEISPEPNQESGLCKFSFGKQSQVLNPEVSKEDIYSGKIQFTGAELCGYGTYILGEAIHEIYPGAELYWVIIYADRSERDPTKRPIYPQKHHVLEIKMPDEQAVVFDTTYGQIRHDRRFLITPSENLRKHYNVPEPSDIIDERCDWKTAKEKFIKELLDIGGLTNDDVTNLKSQFSTQVMQLSRGDRTSF